MVECLKIGMVKCMKVGSMVDYVGSRKVDKYGRVYEGR
jgi:hypothetical protein